MFISYSKIKEIVVILCCTVLIFVPCAILYSSKTNSTYVVVVDAGHGGMDGGVEGADGTLESTLNLEISRKLRKKLESNGIKVIMTRDSEKALQSSKKQDMQMRKKIIQSSHADMVVSIHINKFRDSRRRGVQVFYDDTSKWEKQATKMQTLLNDEINKKYSKRYDYAALKGDYFITKCADVISMIIECGFISNSEDLKLLKSSDYQDILTNVIANGVVDILNN